ncbi:MAG: acyltransferase-domain-containing protein [Benjaminiella poitrasii]|nr:MAG: acyltransferase-domain-containing protein [Benjaminiella poitrasii]
METVRVVINGLLCSLFLWGHTTCIVASQWLSMFIMPFSKRRYYAYHAHIMRQWSQNLFQVMRMFAPGELIISFDKSIVMNDSTDTMDDDNEEERLERLLTRDKTGQVTGISFPDKLIMIANHQIYADWIYIWFLAYLSKAHGAIKIMLKHSLSQLPIYGTGMKFFEFIFLKRRLEHDKDNIINNLLKAKQRNRPLWLVLFPEGTVISDNTRQKSKDYAAKLNMDDFKFSLLPRTTGLLLCKETLGNSVEWLYDLTVAYPGIEPGQNPEDVMTMKRMFCEGNGPHKIHIYIRRYRLDSLPSDTEEFTKWLLQLWSEKDKRLVYFNEHGKLPEEEEESNSQNSIKTVTVPIKLKHTLRECYAYLLYLLFYIPIFYFVSFVIHYIYATFF